MFIFSFLFTGVNGKKSYETCLSLIQEEKIWKIKNGHRFSIFNFELKIKWTNDPRTVLSFPFGQFQILEIDTGLRD